MRTIVIIALFFVGCGQHEAQKKSPYDNASQQQLSYLSTFMTSKDSLKTAQHRAAQVHSNYQKWAIQYWKTNPHVERWLLQVKELNTDDTAAFFTLEDQDIPVSFVSNAKLNSPIYNTITAFHNNSFVIASGRIKSSPSFGNPTDTTLPRIYFEAVFDTIADMNDTGH